MEYKNKRNSSVRMMKTFVPLLIVFLLFMSMGVWAQTPLPCPIYLGDVGEEIPGIKFMGVTADNYCDVDIDGIGDINGDGVDDFSLGYCSDCGKHWYSFILGEDSMNFKGSAVPLKPRDLEKTKNVGGVGLSVAGIGDMTGNGTNDMLFGSPSAQPNGCAYFVDGLTMAYLVLVEQESVGIDWIEAHYGARFDGYRDYSDTGWSVDGAGDFNGDGLPDILIGAPGEDPGGRTNAGCVYVVFGDYTGICHQLELERLDGENGFILTGENPYDFAGWSVSAAGDVNGDGYDDILVGAPNADPNGENSGSCYLIAGGETPPGYKGICNLGKLGSRGKKFNGQYAYDYLGWSVAGGEDVNADGYSDFVLGAYLADNGAKKDVGKAFLIYGKSSNIENILSALDGSNGVVICGLDQEDYFGFDIAMLKDFNGDGYADILIGAPGAYKYEGKSQGETYVIYGNETLGYEGWLDVYYICWHTGTRIYGGGMSDDAEQSGIKVASAGDYNNDGVTDILIATLKGDGDLFLIFGTPDPEISVCPSSVTVDSWLATTGTFTIENVGTGVLEVESIEIPDWIDGWFQFHTPTQFSLKYTDPPKEIPFDVDFDAFSTGTRTVHLLINSNDYDHTPYGYNVTVINRGPPTKEDIINYLLGRSTLPVDINADQKPDISDLVAILEKLE